MYESRRKQSIRTATAGRAMANTVDDDQVVDVIGAPNSIPALPSWLGVRVPVGKGVMVPVGMGEGVMVDVDERVLNSDAVPVTVGITVRVGTLVRVVDNVRV